MYNTNSRTFVTMNKKTPMVVLSELADLPTIKTKIIILLWNTRGNVRKGFRRHINQFIRDHNPDMIILIETRVNKDGVVKSIKGPPYDSFQEVDPVGFAGGILILWNGK